MEEYVNPKGYVMSEPIDTISILLDKEKKYDELIKYIRSVVWNNKNQSISCAYADALRHIGEELKDE